MKKPVISFPHLGNYYIPIKIFLEKLTKVEVRVAPKITKKTIELGSKFSPDFVCVPFKYNLGNFIEALDNGATILLQAGGGCRYGCYGEVQNQILRDLGYDFQFISFLDNGKMNIFTIYKAVKKINKKINIFKYLYYLILAMLMIRYMDKIEDYIRKNIGFEKVKGSFERLEKKMLISFSNTKNIFSLIKNYIKYKRAFKRLEVVKDNPIKVGIIGELFTSMETFSSYFIEQTLAKYNIEVKRFTDLSYLLIGKKTVTKKLLRSIKDYVKYELGADGMDNVARAKYLIDHDYDGIIHIKPFGCTPEVGAIPIINKVCKDYKMPIIYFSFDTQTSNEGVKTRLEALVDMLKERKKRK